MSATAFGPKLTSALLLLPLFVLSTTSAVGQTLVGNVFSHSFENWVDVNGDATTTNGIGPAGWGVLLTDDKPLLEGSDGRPGDGAIVDGAANGNWKPYILINNADVTPANYTINATMATTDNDGMGIVFGYQNEDNYFRLSLRREAGSNFGYSTGTSIQKVVNGVTTQIYFDNIVDHPNNPFDVTLQVAGSDISVVFPDFTHNVSDSDLQPGKYGIHSWGQKQTGATDRQYGTMVHQLSVTSASLNRVHDFDNAVVADWRRLDMVNRNGATSTVGEFFGNFRQDFRNGTIVDDTNGNLPGPALDPNNPNDTYNRADFIGPAVVIDEPGNGSWSNYVFSTRLFTNDNDGIGVVFRVASDNNSFYRVNFINEGGTATSGRPPRGMSMQKFANGTWTELYNENDNPSFVFTPGVPFDVSVIAEGNTFKVGVVSDPDGAVTAINYDPIVDSSSPLLTGSVGFANWGNGDTNLGSVYSAYGNGSAPLLSATLPKLDLVINRATGEVTMENNGGALAIDYYELLSPGGSLNSTIGTGPNQWTALDLAESDPVGQGWDPAGGASATAIAEGRLLDTATIAAGADISLGAAYNGSVNAEDIRFRYRLDNGMFVLGDVSYIGVAPEGLEGDFNADGIVDAADYVLWRNNLGQPEGVLSGNGDGSGTVDVGDYTLWKGKYGQTSPGALAVAQQVPEPGTWLLLGIGAAVAGMARRRLRSNPTRQERTAMRTPLLSALLVAIVAIAMAQPSQAVLVAHYAFDGNANDSSGNGHHGVFVGDSGIVDDPVRGQVLNVPSTGDQGVNINTVVPIPAFEPNTSITLMAWYKRVSPTAPGGDFRYVIDLGQNGNWPIASLGVRANGNIASYIETDEPVSNGDQVNVFGTTVIEGNAPTWTSWHHLAIVHDRSDDIARVYLDGVLDGTTSIALVRDDYAQTWPHANIGRGPEAASSTAHGLIDDARIYSHALSVEEIRAIAQIPTLQATVNRATGELTLENVGTIPAIIRNYSLISAGGALAPANWASVTDNWDTGGAGSIDTDPWAVDSATPQLLKESETPQVNGATIAPGQIVNLGTPWVKTIDEQMTLEFALANGLTLRSPVVYEGGIGGNPYMRSDLTFDGEITLADYEALLGNLGADLSSLPGALRYQAGDLNIDGRVDGSDFATFKNDYDAANGAGAFAAAIGAQVPEPATVAICLFAGVAAVLFRRRAVGCCVK